MFNMIRRHQRKRAEEKEKGNQINCSKIKELKREVDIFQKDLDEAQIVNL